MLNVRPNLLLGKTSKQPSKMFWMHNFAALKTLFLSPAFLAGCDNWMGLIIVTNDGFNVSAVWLLHCFCNRSIVWVGRVNLGYAALIAHCFPFVRNCIFGPNESAKWPFPVYRKKKLKLERFQFHCLVCPSYKRESLLK